MSDYRGLSASLQAASLTGKVAAASPDNEASVANIGGQARFTAKGKANEVIYQMALVDCKCAST